MILYNPASHFVLLYWIQVVGAAVLVEIPKPLSPQPLAIFCRGTPKHSQASGDTILPACPVSTINYLFIIVSLVVPAVVLSRAICPWWSRVQADWYWVSRHNHGRAMKVWCIVGWVAVKSRVLGGLIPSCLKL